MSGGGCLARYTCFDSVGRPCGAGAIILPDYLDWLPIEVKGHWYRVMGYGPPETQDVLLQSQGEQLLIRNIALRMYDWTVHKEKSNGSRSKVEAFIEEGGFSRVPRNQ